MYDLSTLYTTDIKDLADTFAVLKTEETKRMETDGAEEVGGETTAPNQNENRDPKVNEDEVDSPV